MLLINFLCIISSFICGYFCWKIILSIFFISLHYRSVCDSFFSSSLEAHLPLSTLFFRPLTFQTPSPSHAIFIYPIQLITTRCIYVISGFCYEVGKLWALLECYAVYGGISLLTFQDNLLGFLDPLRWDQNIKTSQKITDLNMYIVLFPTLSSSPSMHLISFLSFSLF